ncbi:MAG: PEP-CTERM sorting domain-containing protein [Phycisphaerales bacterium]|nr:PEP-CTERM sorting domain-containing protein [Phycisphaerales bacterium]
MRHSDVSICGRSAAALLGACLCLGVAESASAALIPNAISGVTAAVRGNFDGVDPNPGSPSRAVDGSGLTVGNVNDSSTWTHDNTWQNGLLARGSFASIDADTADTTGYWFAMDLGAVYSDLDKMWIWNDTYNVKGGAKLVDIYYIASLAPGDVPVNSNSSYDFVGKGWTLFDGGHTIPKSPAGPAVGPVESIDLSSITARYIGFNYHTNWGFAYQLPGNPNPRIGFNEIQFTTEVPEPSAIAALAAGGALLMAGRRRKRVR